MNLQKAKVVSKKSLTGSVFELQFKTFEDFNFKAGQFITVKINDNSSPVCFRTYSIASAPNNENLFTLCVKVIENGRGSNWLYSLKEEYEIEFLGPTGNFTFKTPPGKTALFIATGTGIAPFKSIVEDELPKGNTQNMHIIFGLRQENHIFYKEEFENFTKNYPNLKFNLMLSRPENESGGKRGRVTDILNNLPIDTQNTEAYICGLKEMITDITDILIKKGLKKEQIYTEKYN